MADVNKIKKALKKELDKERFEHTLGVMYTAQCLAMAHGVDLEQAQLAGLLHDCAKCIPGEKKIQLCEKQHLGVSEVERKNPSLLHAKLGAFLAKEKYHIKKSESVITPRRSRLSTTKNKKGRKKCKKHVTFSEDLLMIIYIESFKKYNFLNTAGEPDDVKCKCLVF